MRAPALSCPLCAGLLILPMSRPAQDAALQVDADAIKVNLGPR